MEGVASRIAHALWASTCCLEPSESGLAPEVPWLLPQTSFPPGSPNLLECSFQELPPSVTVT